MELEDSDAPSTFQPTLFNASGTHTRPNTTSRHRQFMNWLIQRYGADFLSSGGGVLDVAGGAGGLAFSWRFEEYSLRCRGSATNAGESPPMESDGIRAATCNRTAKPVQQASGRWGTKWKCRRLCFTVTCRTSEVSRGLRRGC